MGKAVHTESQERTALYVVRRPDEDDNWEEETTTLLSRKLGVTSIRTYDSVELLLAACARGQVDTIWMRSLAGLSEDIRKAMQLLEVFHQLGVCIQSEKESFDSSQFDIRRMQESIRLLTSSLCAEEPEQKENVETKLKDEKWTAGVPIYGYYKTRDSAWEPDPRQAEKVIAMFQMACCGCSYNRMLERVAEMEKHCPTGKKWSPDGLNHLFRQTMYAGDRVVIECKRNKGADGTTRVERRKSTRKIIMNHHVPLVSREVMDMVGKLIEAHVFYSSVKLYTDEQIALLGEAWQVAVKEWGLKTMEQIQGV